MSPIEKLNMIADQLATNAVRSAKISEQQWCPEITTMLRMRGEIITKFEGRILSIAAKENEFHIWQRERLCNSKNEYSKIDWEAQHLALSEIPTNLHRFALRFIYHWLPSGRRKKINNQLEDDWCPLCGESSERSSHFLRCKNHAMAQSFKNLTSGIRDVFAAEEARMAPASRILAGLNELRAGADEDENAVRKGMYKDKLHGSLPRKLRRNLPSDNGKDKTSH